MYYIQNICHQFPDLHNQIPSEFQVRKQPPVVIFKFLNRNINSKTSVLESLFNKFVGFQACNFTKERLQHRRFPVNIANEGRGTQTLIKKTFYLKMLTCSCFPVFECCLQFRGNFLNGILLRYFMSQNT